MNCIIEVRDGGSFRDFKAQRSSNPRIAHALEDIVEEGLLIERSAREVDGQHRQRRAAALAFTQPPYSLPHHPTVDDRHDVVALGRGNKFTRRNELTIITAQTPCEFMEVRRSLRANSDDRLKEQLQPVLF